MEECFQGELGKLLVLSDVCAFHPSGFCVSVMGKVSVPVFSLVPSRSCEALVQFILAEHLGRACLKSAMYVLVFA